MELTVTHEQGRVPITILELQGFVNLGSTAVLEDKARQEHAAGMHYLLIDLSGVSSLTSAGLRAIHLINNLLSSNPPADAASAEQQEQPDSKPISPYKGLCHSGSMVVQYFNVANTL